MAAGRILIVEDDAALASLYKSRMESEGFEVRHCANGEDALSEAVAFKPQLILLDLMMPKISGFDVLDILRNTPQTANLKIIVLSALAEPANIERATSLGADRYLVKLQLTMKDLVEIVKQEIS